ncbi:MAG TPA: S41 family peptidase [Pirellulaceae bacterium]|nr:S41 family peptidase [Pirellulaceae bacterium]HMO92623.1 S41 family peptidase [Pirellulaceae bacterium]HMP70230.1 S41 family peptidase [Pirellulaceae bacterium]
MHNRISQASSRQPNFLRAAGHFTRFMPAAPWFKTITLGMLVCFLHNVISCSAGFIDGRLQRDQQDDRIDQQDSGSVAPPFDLEIHIASFDTVWSTIRDSHWDEELTGSQWDEARDNYRPRVERATSAEQVRSIINEMINSLQLSHYGIIPASSYDVVKDGLERGGDGDAGLTFRLVGDQVVVSEVRKDSPAMRMGVKPGWVLKSMADRDVAFVMERLQQAVHGPMRLETLAGLTFTDLASGAPGSTKNFKMIDLEYREQNLDLVLELSPGELVKFGHLPELRLHYESATLADNIGYFRFNAFMNPVQLIPEFRKVIRDEAHHAGIIIDLRGNIGGVAGMTMGMASEFSNQQTSLGTMTMKGSKLNFFVNANQDPVNAPLAILIDECSISSAEIFSGGLQDLKLARLFGARTAGLALPSVVIKLPNGDGFQYALADYHSVSGRSLEMEGVLPDEPIALTREKLAQDADPVLSRAIEWIKQQTER